MCGIFCSLVTENDEYFRSSCHDVLAQQLSNRGPDCNGELQRTLSCNWIGRFSSHVLWLQGEEPTAQPIIDKNNNILLWNGDIFNHEQVDFRSDTSKLSELLCSASMESEEAVLRVLSQVEGPWSFIFWCERLRQLWFGRDAMGRHSLLWSLKDLKFTVSSVASRKYLPSCREVPATGIFLVTMQKDKLNFKLHPWNFTCLSVYDSEDFPPDLEISKTVIKSPFQASNLEVPQKGDMYLSSLNSMASEIDSSPEKIFEGLLDLSDVSTRVQTLTEKLISAVQVRCKTQPPYCKLCVASASQKPCSHSKVAVLFSGGLDSAVLALLADKCVPSTDPIDLINVAFSSAQSALVSEPCHRRERRKKEFQKLPVESQDGLIKTNLQFEVPDRITGKNTYQELLLLRPERKWNFVEVNISKEELASERQLRIADLIHPRCSVLDDSLGCAVWFAARGLGTLHQRQHLQQLNYTSPARVLLLGMGADELLGGYSRCRNMLSKGENWSLLAQSLQNDLVKLPTRNLGRDDRVVSDSGRQARYPFLAEDVVHFLSSLPVHLRTTPLKCLPVGVGEKILLRLVAYSQGLKGAAQAPKRAFQFGSRVAGLEEKGEKGNEICQRLVLMTV